MSKLISTYNNGNIFGVCTLMLFPIFYKNTKSKLKIFIVVLALLLTLSRTVWIGLFFYFLFLYRNQVLKLVKIYLLGGLILLIMGTVIMTRYFQYGSLQGFIFDANLGGRILQIRSRRRLIAHQNILRIIKRHLLHRIHKNRSGFFYRIFRSTVQHFQSFISQTR